MPFTFAQVCSMKRHQMRCQPFPWATFPIFDSGSAFEHGMLFDLFVRASQKWTWRTTRDYHYQEGVKGDFGTNRPQKANATEKARQISSAEWRFNLPASQYLFWTNLTGGFRNAPLFQGAFLLVPLAQNLHVDGLAN